MAVVAPSSAPKLRPSSLQPYQRPPTKALHQPHCRSPRPVIRPRPTRQSFLPLSPLTQHEPAPHPTMTIRMDILSPRPRPFHPSLPPLPRSSNSSLLPLPLSNPPPNTPFSTVFPLPFSNPRTGPSETLTLTSFVVFSSNGLLGVPRGVVWMDARSLRVGEESGKQEGVGQARVLVWGRWGAWGLPGFFEGEHDEEQGQI